MNSLVLTHNYENVTIPQHKNAQEQPNWQETMSAQQGPVGQIWQLCRVCATCRRHVGDIPSKASVNYKSARWANQKWTCATYVLQHTSCVQNDSNLTSLEKEYVAHLTDLHNKCWPCVMTIPNKLDIHSFTTKISWLRIYASFLPFCEHTWCHPQWLWLPKTLDL